MDRRQQLLSLLADSGITAKDGERNIMVCCPLAPYSPGHSRLRDTHPSMGIKYSEFGGFVVNCFTCGFRSPTLASLYDELARCSGDFAFLRYVDRAVALEQLDEGGILSMLSAFESKPKAQDEPIHDNERYTPFLCDKPHWYWATRGIREEIVSIWEGGYDANLQRITLPVRCRVGHLRGATGRTVLQNSPVKYHNYWDMRRGHWLFGEHLVKGGGMIVVEGPLDAVVVYQHLHDLNALDEYSVVALMGAKFTKRQSDMICRISSEVIAFFDRDEAGRTATETLRSNLEGRALVSSVRYGLTEAKDPGGLTTKQFEDLLKGAVLI